MSLTDALELFRRIANNKAQAEAKTLELIRHPEVTAEQLVQVNKTAVHVEKQMRDVITALRGKWGVRDTVFVTPWNNREYDRYDRGLYKFADEEV